MKRDHPGAPHALLDIRNVTRSFVTGTPVLDGVTFAMQREEVIALLGRNGSGKTTLVHIIMGMLFPDSGTVRVFGLSPTERPVEVKRRIGFVGDQQILPPKATITELIALHRALFPTWDSQLERMLLDRFALAGHRQAIGKLSKGQAQQAALLLAVCHRPELLLLDEPAAGLDPVARREFLETSIQLLNREGTAILFSSHHMGDVERLGGRVLLLDRGSIQLDHDLDVLREAHCVVSIAKREIAQSAQLSRIDGCVRVRAVHGDWHAVFRGAPIDVQQRLRAALGDVHAHCVTVPLEELFIEMVGGGREGVAP